MSPSAPLWLAPPLSARITPCHRMNANQAYPFDFVKGGLQRGERNGRLKEKRTAVLSVTSARCNPSSRRYGG